MEDRLCIQTGSVSALYWSLKCCISHVCFCSDGFSFYFYTDCYTHHFPSVRSISHYIITVITTTTIIIIIVVVIVVINLIVCTYAQNQK